MSLLCACASGPPPRVREPSHSTEAFLKAVELDDRAQAYGLLASELRAELNRERFDAIWSDTRTEMLELTKTIRGRDVEHAARARVELRNEENVALVLQDGRWRIEGGLLDAEAQATPLDAVYAMRRALKRQSLPGLLRVLSEERRAAWLAAFERSLAATADSADLEVEIHGDDAVVRTPDGGSVQLRRQAGRWFVTDMH